MKDQDQNIKPENNREKKQDAATEQSSVDRKNEAAVHRTPTATERVRSNAGDGLANEGTTVSYEQER